MAPRTLQWCLTGNGKTSFLSTLPFWGWWDLGTGAWFLVHHFLFPLDLPRNRARASYPF